MFAALLLLALAVPQSAPEQSPPRDRSMRPGLMMESPAREAQLAQQIGTAQATLGPYLELAKLQEDRRAFADAEATLMKARAAFPSNKDAVLPLAAFYNRQGNFDKAMTALQDAAQLTPDDPSVYQLIATYYWEKAFKDTSLLPADKYRYVIDGIAATDRALALKPDYADALLYKNILLRLRANLETDPLLKQQLIAEADALRVKAIELNKTRTGIDAANRGVMLGPVPPPPPPPPPPGAEGASSMAPVRVGGPIKVPTKVRDVRPVYPAEAQAAGVTGVVIIEATIDPLGKVGNARVLRSIPMLDEPALEAVRQWEFTPTYLNGVPVPVIMTVTVNFTMQ